MGDLGTGTGAIALSLAVEAGFERIVATDASEDALGLARENGARLASIGLFDLDRVEFRHGDLFEPLGECPEVAEEDLGVATYEQKEIDLSGIVHDEVLLELLEALARQLAGLPVLIATTLRADGDVSDTWPPAADPALSLHLSLEPLPDAEADELIEEAQRIIGLLNFGGSPVSNS